MRWQNLNYFENNRTAAVVAGGIPLAIQQQYAMLAMGLREGDLDEYDEQKNFVAPWDRALQDKSAARPKIKPPPSNKPTTTAKSTTVPRRTAPTTTVARKPPKK